MPPAHSGNERQESAIWRVIICLLAYFLRMMELISFLEIVPSWLPYAPQASVRRRTWG